MLFSALKTSLYIGILQQSAKALSVKQASYTSHLFSLHVLATFFVLFNAFLYMKYI